MKRKLLTVRTIKALKDGQNGQKRYSLYENRMNHCVFTENPNHKLPKEGDVIVAIEQEITTTDGATAIGWYFVEPFTPALIKQEAARDFDAQVANQKKANAFAFEQRLQQLSTEEISKMVAI